MPFMVDEERLVKPDDTLVQDAGFLRSVIEQARRSHAQPLISVPRRSAQSGAPETLATVTLPVELVNFIFVVVDNLAKGRAIALLTFNPLLPTHKDARVLGFSRTYLSTAQEWRYRVFNGRITSPRRSRGGSSLQGQKRCGPQANAGRIDKNLSRDRNGLYGRRL